MLPSKSSATPFGEIKPSYLVRLEKFFQSKHLSILSLLLWTAGIVLLISLTLLDFLPLLHEYKFNNINTQIAVVKDENPPRPNVTVCLPYPGGALSSIVRSLNGDSDFPSSSHLECRAMENHSWDVWNEPDFGGELNETTLAATLTKKLINGGVDLNSSLSFNQSNFNWNEAILEAVWRLFVCSARQDMTFAAYGRVGETTAFYCDGFDLSSINYISREKMDLLFQRLLDYVGMYLKIEFTNFAGATTTDSLQDSRRALTINGDYFCLALRIDSWSERFTYSPFSDVIGPPWQRSATPMDHFRIFEDKTILYNFVNMYAAIYPVGRRTEVQNREEVALAYALDSTVIETRPTVACDRRNLPVGVCLAQKQLAEAAHRCGCVPFIYRYLPEDHSLPRSYSQMPNEETTLLPYCNFSLYTQCREKLQERLGLNERECRHKCEYRFYDWRQVGKGNTVKNSSNDKWVFRVKVFAVLEPFVKFEIAAKDTPEKFLSQIGGMVSLYLGFSGISICAFVIYCIDHIRKLYRSRTDAKVEPSTTMSTIWMPLAGKQEDRITELTANSSEHKTGQNGQVTREEMSDVIEKMKELEAMIEKNTLTAMDMQKQLHEVRSRVLVARSVIT